MTVSVVSPVRGSTILPGEDMEIEVYRVRVNGPGSAREATVDASRESVTFQDLPPGQWLVTVQASNPDGTIIASGSKEVVVESGKTARADVTVVPLDGEGTLTLSVSWPGASLDDPRIEAFLAPQGGEEEDISDFFVMNGDASGASYSGHWRAGYYWLNLSLRDGDILVWPLNVGVRIIEKRVSSADFPLTEDDFLETGPDPLPSGAVMVEIGSDLNNPYSIDLSGLWTAIDQGEEMVLEMTLNPDSEPDEIRWYLNGHVIPGESGRTLRIGPGGIDESPGRHWISVAASRGTMLASRRERFEIRPAGPPPVLDEVEFREMVAVPPGTFFQEAGRGQGGFEHTLSSYEIARYQVTYELWYTVRRWGEQNGYHFVSPGREGSRGRVGGSPTAAGRHEPVTGISWRDALVWMNAYSESSGLSPVYYTDRERRVPIRTSQAQESLKTKPGSIDNPFLDRSARGYRLPTEGEWQYAASYRDGTGWAPPDYASGATADYTDEAATGEVAWYGPNSDTGEGPGTQRVGKKRANDLGIHDMNGNAREWVWDWRGAYPGEGRHDYTGVAEADYRVLRGGGWNDEAPVTVSRRYDDAPWEAGDYGLRPARTVETVYGVGDFGPAGGWIVYVDENDDFSWTYLEVAPVRTEWSGKPWGGHGTEVGSCARGTSVGTGAGNTAAIRGAFGDSEPRNDRADYAARIADDLVVERHGDSFSDWFLPSRDELDLMYRNLHSRGLGGFGDVIYWSSSEEGSIDAWRQSFGDGSREILGKSQLRRVRALRAF
ncbi:hypothetical protein AU468_04605 [Alkalispirochaeta sphaeroplastigenens]|uniref:Sulfatase-modifying factor enzyme-like domain-containing protein n=1 Tax=Alkalispirochaeta sphaeroplastigenens TaxID=1187066 RepID=A0A2S4JWS4_9SPIO|nr:hypothetical protein AU468_04605 [Alkalispirochaeta sphaeroplastigenens]